MPTRSLRWKLLSWYASMTCALAIAAGYLMYANVRRTTERNIDAGLWFQAIGLSRVIVPAGDGRFELELSQRQIERFNEEGDDAVYYSIWAPNGKLIDASDPAREIPMPTGEGARDRGDYREAVLHGAGDSLILVGRSVAAERAQLRNLAALILAVGTVGVLAVLATGWFLAGRALAPIKRISSAAASVSASNLSERIDVTRMETELADLATSFNEAFDRIQHAFEQQTRFTADASHELRTPLSIVLSQAELALRQPRSEEEYREMLEPIRRAAQRMKGVVEGLLTLARADAGQTSLDQSHLDLREVVEDTCKLLEPIAAERNVTIGQRLVHAPVIGDRDRLAEAIANLVGNAIRYNVPGGRVEVTMAADNGEVSLRIADTGPGIAEEDRKLIFDRFYRVDKARSRAVDGTGLGLAITKWIIDAHGGTISVQNGDPIGAVFDVRLKYADVPT
ncbi:MAG TPA: heavy metal sensor histidine kinase [Lacipirellula sp.]